MKHQTFISTSKKSNICNPTGESKTDKSQFRPDIASTRDKAIQLEQTGLGRTGLYDDTKITDNEKQAIAYARKQNRDITEIESIKNTLEKTIENGKEKDKKQLNEKKQNIELAKTLKNIEENTKIANEKIEY